MDHSSAATVFCTTAVGWQGRGHAYLRRGNLKVNILFRREPIRRNADVRKGKGEFAIQSAGIIWRVPALVVWNKLTRFANNVTLLLDPVRNGMVPLRAL